MKFEALFGKIILYTKVSPYRNDNNLTENFAL